MAGYLLFAAATGYGLWHAPPQTWTLEPLWLGAAVLLALFLLLLQTLHVALFLRHHRLEQNWLWLTLFTTRKGVLNTLMPAKTGTLVLLRMLTSNYPQLRWHDYLRYMLLGMLVTLLASLLALAGLLLGPAAGALLTLAAFGLCLLLSRVRRAYLPCLPGLFLLAGASYLVLLGAIWAVLQGMGHPLDFVQASALGITLNTLSQLAITPGNLGARELLLGLVGQRVQIPVALGILSGAAFFVIRLAVFAAVQAGAEWLAAARQAHRGDSGRARS